MPQEIEETARTDWELLLFRDVALGRTRGWGKKTVEVPSLGAPESKAPIGSTKGPRVPEDWGKERRPCAGSVQLGCEWCGFC